MSDATFTDGAAGSRSGQLDLAWSARIPLLNNRFLWWDFVKLIVISMAGMWVAVLLVSLLIDASDPILLPWQLPLACGAVVGACFVIACLVMGNGYAARFLVDRKGVHWDSGAKEKAANRAVVAIGALAGSAQATGAGLLAASEESGAIAWSRIRALNVHPGARVVSVRNGWRVVVRLYVPAESWDAVVARLQAGVASGS